MATSKPAPDPLKPPGRVQAGAIVKRYLKPEVAAKLGRLDWAREMPVFHALWKEYPSLDFWTKHELPFKLNSLLWFKTEEGKTKLKSDWSVFHLVIEDAPAVPVDAAPNADDELPYAPVTRRPSTIASFFKHGR